MLAPGTAIDIVRPAMSSALAEKPIPIVNGAPTTAGTALVSFDHAAGRAHEELIDLCAAGIPGQNYYGRTDGKNPPYNRPVEGAIQQLLARKSVAGMLLEANNRLRPLGLAVFVLDAYRPIATQLGLWKFFRNQIAAATHGLTDAQIDARAEAFVSDPRRFNPEDSSTWPLHSTGGAVDVVLVDAKTHAPLDCGGHFDEISQTSHSDHWERRLQSGEISHDDLRLRNRRILYWSMREADFTNYAYEYWHYDFGDQMHVLSLAALGIPGPRKAWYPYVAHPSGATLP